MPELNLSEYRINHFDQFGECGIVEKLFEITNTDSGWLVEFGAWQGIHFSNTRYHFLKGGFNVLFAEPIEERFSELEENYGYGDDRTLLNTTITTTGAHSLNNIFDQYEIYDIALLSIDVDGEDYNIWKSLDKTIYRPKFVIIEDGRWPDDHYLDNFVKQFDDDGYVLIAITGNFIFCDKALGITSPHTVHELMRSSGMQEYDLHFGNITHEEQLHRNKRMEFEKDLYSKTAGPQIIHHKEPTDEI